jgi:hypothetical protein
MFRSDSEFRTLESFFLELRSKSVEFPTYNPEMFSAIANVNNAGSLSPESSQRSINRQQASLPAYNNNTQVRSNQAVTSPRFMRVSEQQMSNGVVKLNEEQAAKLNSELDIVESNVQVLNEILTHLQSNGSTNLNNSRSEQNEDVVLLKELNKTCREMQKRITQLIGNITNENIISKKI